MKHRVLFGRALPASFLKRPAPVAGAVALTVCLLAVGWLIATLMVRRSRLSADNDIVYLWPD